MRQVPLSTVWPEPSEVVPYLMTADVSSDEARAFYAAGRVVIELDDQRRPVRAFRCPGEGCLP